MSIKQYLRSELKIRRHEYYRRLSKFDLLQLERLIIEKVLSLPISFSPPQSIACYYSVKEEVPTELLIAELWRRDIQVGLPHIHEDLTLSFHLYHKGDYLETSVFNIPQPPLTARLLHPAVIFVPLLGFNREGHRVGYGLGYYDRVLQAIRAKRTSIAIGLAFGCQEVKEMFAEEFDEELDWIITEHEVIKRSS